MKKEQLYQEKIKALEELNFLLNSQIKLLAGDEWKDAEKYGYSALALSLRITSIEFKIASLTIQIEAEGK